MEPGMQGSVDIRSSPQRSLHGVIGGCYVLESGRVGRLGLSAFRKPPNRRGGLPSHAPCILVSGCR